ncbi:MAG: hypothetical protein KGJ77_00895 [Acidobacteriota bacterium]|nr:hypothetical protein [Acidobacteriota bacterium]
MTVLRDVVAVLGEPATVAPFALAGARVLGAEHPEEARRQWRSLGADVALVVLTPRAAEAVAELPPPDPSVLWVVLP